MKKNILLCIIIIAASAFAANAATKVSAQSGPFGWGSTWADGQPPASGDNIIILPGHSVHGTAGKVVGDLTVNGSLTLSFPGLTVNGNLTNTGLITGLSGYLYFKGEKCVNNGKVSVSTFFNSADEQKLSGDGLWDANAGQFNGGRKVLEDVQMSRGAWEVNSQVVINQRWSMTGGKINKTATGIIETPANGIVEFHGAGHFASNESTGNLWKARIIVKEKSSRTASNTSAVSAHVIVEKDATLAASLNMTLHLKDTIVINSGGKLNGQAIRLSGKYVINHGEVFPTVLEFNRDDIQEIGGEGAWRNSNAIYFRGSGIKSLTTDMNASKTNVWVESPMQLNNHNLILNTGNFSKPATGSINAVGEIIGNGKIVLAGNGNISSNESTGNLWRAPIIILSGAHASFSSTFSTGVNVESGATLSAGLNTTIHFKGDVWIKEGAKLNGQGVRLSGAIIINNGEISPTTLEFNSDEEQEIGGGVWRNSNAIYFRGRGRKSLFGSITTSVGSVVVESRLNLNNFDFTVNGGNFSKPASGSIFGGTGKIISTGNGHISSLETAGNLWRAPLEIASGTRAANGTSSFTAPITVKSGAILSTVLRVTIHAIGGLTVEQGAEVTGANLELHNGDFVNNGAVKTVTTYFNGTNTLSGMTGSFAGNGTYFRPGAAVKLDGVQQFRNLNVDTSGAFDISNQTIKVSGVLVVKGNLATNASTIEFNSTSAEQSVPTNIDYYNLTINNSREVNLGAPETVRSVLRLEKGIFNIAVNRLTVNNCGQIVYVNGTLNGTPVCS
jgi:hypothetical protein